MGIALFRHPAQNGHGLGPGDGGPGIGPQGPVVGPAALHDAQLVKGLYRVQIPRGDVFGIGVGKGDRRIGVQVQSQPVGRHQGKVPPGDVAVGVEIGDVSAGDPGDDAQLTQAGGIGPGPVVGHVRKGVGGGAGEGHGIPGQIAAGVGGGDGDLMAALAQAGEGGGEGAGGGVPLEGDRLSVNLQGHPIRSQAPLEIVGDLGGCRSPGDGEGDRGRGGVPGVFVGQDHLIQPQGALLGSGQREAVEGDRPLRDRGADLFPAGKV